jgi:AraC-like DNA-binding protein
MTAATTGRFSDPYSYAANLPGMAVEMLVTRPGAFDGRVAWGRLPHLDFVCAHETLSRIAVIALEPPALSATFSMQAAPTLLSDGLSLQAGDIVLHAGGERLHQRTTGASRWGALALAPQFSTIYAAALGGTDPRRLPPGSVVRPPVAEATHFLGLIGRIGHLVETRPLSIGHPEIVRSLEQELAHALFTCLRTGETCANSAARQRHVEIMAGFEDVLAAHPGRMPPVGELCARIGVAERTLRACCTAFLGISPAGYIRLRRLNLARAAILRADPGPGQIGEIARGYGFTEIGRFAASYRQAFGESPSVTLRRARRGDTVYLPDMHSAG